MSSPPPPPDVKSIIERIGDVSSVLQRARALRGMSLIPKHATLKINKTMSSNTINRTEAATPSVATTFKPPKLSKRPGALRFINKGYYMAKQRALEKRLEAKGIDLRTTNHLIQALEKDKHKPDSVIALETIQEFLGRDNRWKHDRKSRAALKAVKADRGEVLTVTVPQPINSMMNWWDKDYIQAINEESAVRDQKLHLESSIIPLMTRYKIGSLDLLPLHYKFKESACSHLIQHPEPLSPTVDVNDVTPAVYLTAAEKKRIRRQRNKEKEQDKRDKIQIGLMEPPPPKVKLSNLMRVLGESAAANPTAVEATVRQQVAERLKAHELRNEKSRLSEEARRAKTIKKWTAPDETSNMIQVALFQVKDITSKQCLFKVHQNAKELHLTGVAAFCPGNRNVIVVEGSTRAVRKYKSVLLRRIQWPGTQSSKTEQDIGDADTVLDPFCSIIWEGPISKRCFPFWSVQPCATLAEMKNLFEKYNASIYWNTIDRYRAPHADLI